MLPLLRLLHGLIQRAVDFIQMEDHRAEGVLDLLRQLGIVQLGCESEPIQAAAGHQVAFDRGQRAAAAPGFGAAAARLVGRLAHRPPQFLGLDQFQLGVQAVEQLAGQFGLVFEQRIERAGISQVAGIGLLAVAPVVQQVAGDGREVGADRPHQHAGLRVRGLRVEQQLLKRAEALHGDALAADLEAAGEQFRVIEQGAGVAADCAALVRPQLQAMLARQVLDRAQAQVLRALPGQKGLAEAVLRCVQALWAGLCAMRADGAIKLLGAAGKFGVAWDDVLRGQRLEIVGQ